MFLNLVIVPSYRSQSGFLISFLNHFKKVSTIYKKQVFFIIQLPARGDP